jgi:hypothetical protein
MDGPEAYAAIFPAPPEEGEEGSGSGGSRSRGPSGPTGYTPTVGKPKARNLDDRVRAVLEDSDGDWDAHDVLEAVNADGGRTVSLGGVRNALGNIKKFA